MANAPARVRPISSGWVRMWFSEILREPAGPSRGVRGAPNKPAHQVIRGMALPLDISKKVSIEEGDIGRHIDSPALGCVVAEVKRTCVTQVEQQLVAASHRGHGPRLATDADVERRGLISRRSATVTVSWGLPFYDIVLGVVGFSSALQKAVAPDLQTRFGWTIGELPIVAHIYSLAYKSRTVRLLDCPVPTQRNGLG